MRESDIVRTITIRHKAEGSDQAKASLLGVAAAQDKLAQSSEQLAKASESSAKRQASVAKQFETLAMRADPARRAIEELNRAHKTLQAGVDQNSARLGVANAAMQVYVEKANKAIEARNRLTAAEREASMVTRNRINEITGVTSTASRNPLGRAEDIAAYGQELTRVREKFNPLFAVGQQYRRTVEEINAATRAGALTEKERAAAIEVAKTTVQNQAHALRDGAKAGRLMAGEMANLSFQLNDVVTGLALGQSPFMILAQQGGQVYQILANSQSGVTGAVKEIGSQLRGLITPARLAVGGLAGLGAVALVIAHNWAESQKEIEQSLIGIGRRTGTSVSDINKFAKENATATGLSVDQARSVAIEFTKTGNVAIAGLRGLGDAVHGFSILTGTDAAAATKTLAQALSGDLVKGADDLNKTYGFLDVQTRDLIRTLEIQGQRQQAIQVILNGIKEKNKEAADSVGLLTRAYEGLGNVLSAVKNAAIPAAGNQEQIDELQRQREQLVSGGTGGLAQTVSIIFQGKDAVIAGLDEVIAKLKEVQQRDGEIAQAEGLKKIGIEADNAVRAILPQIGALEGIERAINRIQDAQSKGRAATGGGDALAVLQHQKSLQEQALAASIRQAQVVVQLQQHYGGVSAQTALALRSLEGQLSVAQALTTATQQKAQAEANFKQMVDQGVAPMEAQRIAAEQLNVAKAQATTSVLQQVQALKDQNDMIRAAQTGTEAQTAAAIAYRNAIDAGADSTAAAALRSETLKNNLLQAGSAASNIGLQMDNLDWSEFEADVARQEQAQRDYDPTKAGSFDVPAGKQYESFIPDPHKYEFYQHPSEVPLPGWNSSLADSKMLLESEQKKFEETVQAQLKKSIEELTKATDENTAATLAASATLNPLYSEGRDALKIGYYKAATGLEGIVGGSGGMDSTPVHMMLTPGEHLKVTPPGQVSNDNSTTSNTTVIQNFNFGSSEPASRRNARQVAQGYGQMMASLS